MTGSEMVERAKMLLSDGYKPAILQVMPNGQTIGGWAVIATPAGPAFLRSADNRRAKERDIVEAVDLTRDDDALPTFELRYRNA